MKDAMLLLGVAAVLAYLSGIEWLVFTVVLLIAFLILVEAMEREGARKEYAAYARRVAAGQAPAQQPIIVMPEQGPKEAHWLEEFIASMMSETAKNTYRYKRIMAGRPGGPIGGGSGPITPADIGRYARFDEFQPSAETRTADAIKELVDYMKKDKDKK
jgi:cell division protein FtsW (lipid II flippase)